MKQRQSYSNETRWNVIKDILNGVPFEEIAKTHDVKESTVSVWLSDINMGRRQAFEIANELTGGKIPESLRQEGKKRNFQHKKEALADLKTIKVLLESGAEISSILRFVDSLLEKK